MSQVRVDTRISTELDRRLMEEARRQRRTKANLLRLLIEQHVGQIDLTTAGADEGPHATI